MTDNLLRFDAHHHPDIDLLSDYVSGGGSPETRAAITAHLVECEACREDVRSLRATVALLHDLPQIAPPVSFQLGAEYAKSPRSGGSVTPEPSKIVRLLPLVRTLSVAAVLLFMVIGGAALFDSRDHNDGQQSAMIGPTSVTEGDSDALKGSGNQSSDDEAPARSAAVPPTTGGGVVDRGDSASADVNNPAPAGAAQDAESTPPGGSVGQGSIASESVDTSGKDGFPWLSTTIGLGALAVVLIGLWLVLARMGRQR
ncbi:MAG: zf-HC2 domain-containing protein [Thermomicrobiales bacterium]